MASSIRTLVPIGTGTTQVFPGKQPQTTAIYFSAVGGTVTVGDANVAAGRGIVIPSNTTQVLSDFDNLLSLENIYVFVAAGTCAVTYLERVPS